MSKFIEDHEIKEGTMCWIGVDDGWLEVIVFQAVGSEIRAWFRQHRQTSAEFRANGFALSPIGYPVHSPREILSKEAQWDQEGR